MPVTQFGEEGGQRASMIALCGLMAIMVWDGSAE